MRGADWWLPSCRVSPVPAQVTNADGLAYALFLTKFADALHLKGLELSLDYFSNL